MRVNSLLCLLILPFVSFSQKHDYNWVLGDEVGTILDFNKIPVSIQELQKEAFMYVANASMSSSDGELLFYTNGCDVFNKEHEVMENGDNINPGAWHDDRCNVLGAYPATRGVLSLPIPKSDDIYYLFHQAVVFQTQPVLDAFVNKQYFSIIDMNQNGGVGEVSEKNKLILEDTLQSGDLTAVQHANNEDWWVMMPKRHSNKYFRALFTANGVEGIFEQEIGDPTTPGSNGGGQAMFTPDGTKYVKYNPVNGIFIFDFDRETGELSNYQHVAVKGDSAFAGGAAISANSRFLYISAETKFFQFDLEADDIAASQVFLDEYDGFQSPFAATFRLCQLAPDCKIYCACGNSADVLHVVNNPDEKGFACDFVQHGVQLAEYNSFSIPNFPNYRLGTGQPACMPVAAGEVEEVEAGVLVYPNPARGQVAVVFPQPLPHSSEVMLFNAVGTRVLQQSLKPGETETEIDLSGLPDGLYFWEVRSATEMLGSGKVIVTK